MTTRARRPLLMSCLITLSACHLVTLASGCGASKVELTGRVTYRGEPLTRGTVTVFCQDGRIYSGLLGTGGQYTIPDVPAGKHRATVITHPPIPTGFFLRQRVPPTKDGPRLSDPRVDGASPGRQAFVSIPERYADPEQSGLACTVGKGARTADFHLHP